MDEIAVSRVLHRTHLKLSAPREGSATERVSRAYITFRRELLALAAKQPLQALAVLRELREDSEQWRDEVARSARDAGLSWSVIGGALGISKQAAQQRYGARD